MSVAKLYQLEISDAVEAFFSREPTVAVTYRQVGIIGVPEKSLDQMCSDAVLEWNHYCTSGQGPVVTKTDMPIHAGRGDVIEIDESRFVISNNGNEFIKIEGDTI